MLEGDRVLVRGRIEGFAFVKAAIEESHKTLGSEGPSPFRDVKGRPESTKVYRELSYELPVCTTALGRVLLAFLPTNRVSDFLCHDIWAKKRSKSEGVEDLLSELAKVREQGYCVMHFEPHNESCSLAAPIFDASDAVKAAVSVSCRRHLSVWNDEHALSEVVKEAAWEISSKPLSEGEQSFAKGSPIKGPGQPEISRLGTSANASLVIVFIIEQHERVTSDLAHNGRLTSGQHWHNVTQATERELSPWALADFCQS